MNAHEVLRNAGPTVSMTEAAAVVEVSVDLMRAMYRRGELEQLGVKVLKLGNRYRVTTSSLRRLVEATPSLNADVED